MSDEPTENDATPPKAEKAMGFFDHLEELRWTLVKCAIAFVIGAALVGYFLKEFNEVLLWPLQRVRESHPELAIDLLGTTTILEGFNVIVQMCVLGGLLLASPVILYFIGQFVAPALTAKERRVVVPLCISTLILFLVGASFGFFVLTPSTLNVSIEINAMFNFALRWTPGSYYTLVTWLTLGVGASFEFPQVIVLLVWMGLLSTAFLRKYRRHAIVAIIILAAVITPTQDPFNLTLFAAPLYVLYEIAILVSGRVEKRRALQLVETT